MKDLKYIILFLMAICSSSVMAQSDIEITDSTSTEWGDNIGGGILPSLPTDPVKSLTLSKTEIEIEGGERFRLIAVANASAANKNVIWSVADKRIAMISNNGTVTGLKTGITSVTATSVSNPEISASCKVTVTSDYIAPSSGWILPWGKEEAWTMKYKYFEQSNYVEPSNDVTGRTWKEYGYNDDSWQTLTGPMGSEGIWYAPYNYVWRGEYNCFCLRRSFDMPVVGTGIYSFKMQHDDDIQIYLNGELVIDEPDWTDERISTYVIPNTAFVAGENQLAIFIKQNHGGAYLDYGLYYESVEPVTNLTLSSSDLTLKKEEYVQLSANVNENAGDKSVVWSVANNEIASVSPTGRVKGLKSGNTIVTATSAANPEVYASCKVTVTSAYIEADDLPEVPFEFLFDAANFDAKTNSIPNHDLAVLSGASLQLSATIPTANSNYLTINERCEGYLDRWGKDSRESGSYFYRNGQQNMTIVCKVKPKRNTDNAMDFISNRAGGYNYMLRIGQKNSIFLHTGIAYDDRRVLSLPESNEPQTLAVRVNGKEDYIQIDNLTTNESKIVTNVNWGGSDNIMKFFYNDGGEYWMGDFYWMYYSFEYLTDEQLSELYYYKSDYKNNITYTPGDVNNDGKVSIHDVVLMINAILGKAADNFNSNAADINGDGKVQISDVVLVINIILGVNDPVNVKAHELKKRELQKIMNAIMVQ